MLTQTILMTLALAHMFADYPFQTDWMAANKHTSSLALSIHVAIHGIVAGILLWATAPIVYALMASISVMVFHAVIDVMNLNIRDDQTAHILSFIGVCLILPGVQPLP